MKLNRRKFVSLCSGVLLGSVDAITRADHHVISVDPLQVAFDLGPSPGRYTTTEDFYIRNHNQIPEKDQQASILIEGDVAKPQRLLPPDLGKLKIMQLGAVLECAGNPVGASGLISNGLWQGWPLKSILELARPRAASPFLHLFGRDGYARSVPMERAYNDALLITDLNGRSLPQKHGGPWRVLFPGWYGMDSVKWLERLVVSSNALPSPGNAYLEARKTGTDTTDWKSLPKVQVKSIIVSPVSRSVVPRGVVQIQGLAWSGEGSVVKVEVSRDAGSHWRSASVSPYGLYEWVLWRASLPLDQTGAVELVCRATDSQGHTQPERRDPVRLDTYANNWYHRVQCIVV